MLEIISIEYNKECEKLRFSFFIFIQSLFHSFQPNIFCLNSSPSEYQTFWFISGICNFWSHFLFEQFFFKILSCRSGFSRKICYSHYNIRRVYCILKNNLGIYFFLLEFNFSRLIPLQYLFNHSLNEKCIYFLGVLFSTLSCYAN